MLSDLPLFPERASTISAGVDHLYFFLLAVAAVLLDADLLAGPLLRHQVPPPVAERPRAADRRFAAAGTGLDHHPFRSRDDHLLLGQPDCSFATPALPTMRPTSTWSASSGCGSCSIPKGQREINELHVPVGRPFKLMMTSQDVIHSFYIPAFRIKQDVLPGRYTSMWFQPTKTGEYHLFCAEYCGTNHSEMIGRVVRHGARWITKLAERRRFGRWPCRRRARDCSSELGCASCHRVDGRDADRRFAGLFGTKVQT